MKLLRQFTLFAAANLVSAWGRQKIILEQGASLSDIYIPPTGSPPAQFLLDVELLATPRDSALYIKANQELSVLKEKPICSRVAARLFIDSCKTMDKINEENYNQISAQIQVDQVDSFAVALSMCDMERADFKIPHECATFRSGVLYGALERKVKVHYQKAQIDECVSALGRDINQWSTFLSKKDSAMLFCRAARVDLSKDESIELHQKLVEVLELFTRDLETDLNSFKDKLKAGAESVDFTFEKIIREADDIKFKLQKDIETVSKDIKNAGSNMESIVNKGAKAQQILENLSQTIIAGHAEMASSQRNELELTTQHVANGLQSMHERLADSEKMAQEMGQFIISIHRSLIQIAERQNMVEERAAAIFTRLINATELLQGHQQELLHAGYTASAIREELEAARSSAGSFAGIVSSGGGIWDWIIRITLPLLSLILGNYGLTPSLTRNAALLISGLGLAELVVQFGIHYDESCLYDFLHRDYNGPSSFTQQAASSLAKVASETSPTISIEWDLPTIHPEMARDLN